MQNGHHHEFEALPPIVDHESSPIFDHQSQQKQSPSSLNLVDCLFDFVIGWLDAETNSCSQLKIAWLFSIFASCLVILTGIAPAFLLSAETGHALTDKVGSRRLNLLLAFSIGSLLGDVFLHILPEAWAYNTDSLTVGLWTLSGLLICYSVEKCCSKTIDSRHKATALINLLANIVDNFTHGLAVGGSFRVSIKFGLLTTFAILVHEIPHEIGDFAILLRANFNRIDAVKAQFLTAGGGIAGATLALLTSSPPPPLLLQETQHPFDTSFGGTGSISSPDVVSGSQLCNWVLPFTAGGFLNIALVQVLPELLQETCTKENAKQIVSMLSGVLIMLAVNLLI